MARGDFVVYEWTVEQGDDGEVSEAFPSLTDARRFTGDTPSEIALTRVVWESDGTLADRQYAYLLPDGSLPIAFDGGARIPSRFLSL